jgi:hypothetical protein
MPTDPALLLVQIDDVERPATPAEVEQIDIIRQASNPPE